MIRSHNRGSASYYEIGAYIISQDTLTRVSKTISDYAKNEFTYLIYDGEEEVQVNSELKHDTGQDNFYIASFKTQKFNILIDQLDIDTYRYSSWNSSTKLTRHPDLILKNGYKNESEIELSYHFKKGAYRYVCIYNKETNNGSLKVFENEREVLQQAASVFLIPNEIKPYVGSKNKLILNIDPPPTF
jgi:hypothetical protein